MTCKSTIVVHKWIMLMTGLACLVCVSSNIYFLCVVHKWRSPFFGGMLSCIQVMDGPVEGPCSWTGGGIRCWSVQKIGMVFVKDLFIF
jgi:hypothetical protein